MNSFTESRMSSLKWVQPDNPDAILSVGNSAFAYVSGLTSVTIPSWLTFDSYAFRECPDLKSVTFASGVTTVYNSAFQDCSELTTLSFPESLETIEKWAFNRCSKITSVTFPAKMTLIASESFNNCGLTTVTLPAGAKLEGAFAGNPLTEINWPATPMSEVTDAPFGTQNGVSTMKFPSWMKNIPNSMCSNWKGLTKVIIEEGVESIGTSCFMDCSALDSISVPSSLRTIGHGSFWRTKSLKNIVLNEGLETIVTSAFHESGLTSVTFPSTITSIQGSFSSSLSLESVDLSKTKLTTIVADNFSGCKALKTVKFPATLTSIESQAFYKCEALTNVTLPSSLASIGEKAFMGCSSFGELNLPDGVAVGKSAFRDAAFTAVNFQPTSGSFDVECFYNATLPTTLTLPSWLTSVPSYAFWKTNIVTINLHEGLERIESYAFASCSSLRDVVFPSSLDYIGQYAFHNSGGQVPPWGTPFGSITINDGVVIDQYAFSGATITEIIFNGCPVFEKNSMSGLSKVSSVTFPECMDSIPEGFCKGWTSLKSVKLPSNLKSIGTEAFAQSGLGSIDFPEGLDSIAPKAFYNSGITSIKWPKTKIKLANDIFNNCSYLESLEIPAWMDRIPDNSFLYCIRLGSITWAERKENDPQTVYIGKSAFQGIGTAAGHLLTSIDFPELDIVLGESAFQKCIYATSISWPQNHTVTLGSSSFRECDRLAELSIPDYVTEIPEYCYATCKALVKPFIGKNVTKIGDFAFSSCNNLTAIEWGDKIAELGTNAFSSTGVTDLDIPATVTSIGDNCFSRCSGLKTLTLHEGLESIGKYAFNYCSNLESLSLPSTIKYVGTSAFSCTGLTSLYIPSVDFELGTFAFSSTKITDLDYPGTLTSIPQYCFSDCKLLKTVTFHDGLQTIDKYAFSGCIALDGVSFPDSFTEINEGAFKDCSNLKTADFNVGLTKIGLSAFKNTTSLTQIILPSTLTTLEGFTFNASGLTKVINEADSLKLSSGMFEDCKSLVTFKSEKHISSINNDAFKNCSELAVFD